MPSTAKALPKGFFAENSALAEGKWVRFSVTSTGMKLIPAATLRAMGFADISKVNVYGTGGKMVPEKLDPTISDDLPILPSIKSEKGLIFFANDIISWNQASDVPYSHTINPYDTRSLYFLSDREPAKKLIMQEIAAPVATDSIVTTFKERRVHETEKAAPGESGRTLFGEDFRGNKTISFPFTLDGLAGKEAIVKIKFGAKSASTSSIIVTANGHRLPASSSDQLKASVSSTEYCKMLSTVKTFDNTDTRLNLDIAYSSSATASFARLDFIELFYDRQLALDKGQLYFYTTAKEKLTGHIQGCSASTVIWDVTVPYDAKTVKFNLKGSTAEITLQESYHEYIAFDPERVEAISPEWENVANQNIHGMETPDMVIISYDTYMDAARRIAALHRDHDGMKVLVLRPEEIYNEFSGGVADVSAFRKLLKMWYDRDGEEGIKYCLLMGRPHFDNRGLSEEARGIGYRPMPIWQEPNLFTEAASYSTDCYIAMLDDCKSGFNMASAKQRVAVGRLPVTSAKEANEMATKIEKYVKEPNYGAWRNKMLFLADDIDSDKDADTPVNDNNPATFFDQTQKIYSIISSSEEGKKYLYDRIYMDSYQLEYTSVGLTYPQAKSKLLATIDEGVVYANYLGHANPRSWTHEKILEWNDINSFSNKNLPFLFGGTCEFARWDANAVSGGEIMLLNPNGGVIAMVMPSRTVYITQNYKLNRAMAPYLLKKKGSDKPVRLGDFYINGMNDYSDTNKLRFCFLGDPALTFPQPINTVSIDTIDDHDMSDTEAEAPVIPALGKISLSGSIHTPTGEIDESFTGSLELVLYDSEKVISTKDFGKGLDRTYNDRKVRLTTTSVRVEQGKWTARLLLPSEIENNYSPALISAYAWNDQNGVEAHGMTENIYIYGYDSEAPSDEKDPVIESYYLNSPSFVSGNVVHSTPVVFASLYDESGINISDAGIGHRITLTLDGKKVYSDVSDYFSVNPEREGAGNLCYPLDEIEPGKHTLTLSAWDNAGNSTSSTIEFNVGAAIDPVITDITTNVNPASTSVVFAVTVDRPNSTLGCTIEVFDLNGRVVWSSTEKLSTDTNCVLNTTWNLCDHSGVRVPRGIYLYRATVTTQEGTYSSKSRKLAVTAQ